MVSPARFYVYLCIDSRPLTAAPLSVISGDTIGILSRHARDGSVHSKSGSYLAKPVQDVVLLVVVKCCKLRNCKMVTTVGNDCKFSFSLIVFTECCMFVFGVDNVLKDLQSYLIFILKLVY